MTKHRILIVDDNRSIHDDFTKILQPRRDLALDTLEAELFETLPVVPMAEFELVHAYQGPQALELVSTQAPFALAFVDMRMPPGWDGLETIERIWAVDPDVQVVICSAYSDHSWAELRSRLGERDNLLIMRKPFDPVEALQSAHALTGKWWLSLKLRERVGELEALNVVLRHELEHRERTEHDLRIARKLGVVGQFAAGIAHEIASPICYVANNLEHASQITLDGNGDDAELPEVLASMRHGIERITTIVRAMQDLSHPGQRHAKPEDLNRAINAAIEISKGSYRCIADLVRDLRELPPVTCHVSDLHQVFLNLITNAAHAMEGHPGGRGTLTVASRVEGPDVVVSITDTGAGIPELIRTKVFEPFFTTKDTGKGTGQGLSISRALVVDRHGGSLTFDSELGRGTAFHVRIPIAGQSTARERHGPSTTSERAA
jgi:signal transduction histidine kinase